MQAIQAHAVLQIVGASLKDYQTAQILLPDALLIEEVEADIGNLPGAGGKVAVHGGIVLVAVQFHPGGGHKGACPTVTGADRISDQLTSDQLIVLEDVAVAVSQGLLAVHGGVGIGIEVVVIRAVHDPAGLQLTVDGIVQFAIQLHQAILAGEVINITAFADEPAIHHAVAVACSGNGGTPVNHGLTVLTESTAGVAVLGAGGFLVGKRHGSGDVGCAFSVILGSLHTMVMTAVPVGIPGLVADVVVCRGAGGGIGIAAQLRIHLDPGACERSGGAVGKGDQAAVGLNSQIHGQDLIACLVVGIHPDLAGMAVNCHHGLHLPGTGGDGHQSQLTGGGDLTGSGDGNGGDILIRNQGIGGLEALGHIHVVQMPEADIVQIHSYGDRLHVFHSRCHHIHIVYGAQQQTVSLRIPCNHPDGSIFGGIDNDIADNGGIVALLVTDGELHLVTAVGQSHIIQGHLAVAGPGQVGSIVHAVNVGPAGACVDAGIVTPGGIFCHGSNEADGIGGDGLAIQLHALVHTGHRIGHAAEDGSFAVIHCGGVVHGDIINVENEISVDGGLVTVGIAILAVLLGNVELQQLNALIEAVVGIGRDILGDIVPAGFIEGIHEADFGHAGLTSTGNGPLAGGVGGGVSGFVEGVDDQVDTQAVSLVGNVKPHTQSLCVLKDLLLAGDQAGQLIACLQRVGEVDLHGHGVLAAADMAAGGIHDIGFARGIVVVVACAGAAVEAVQILILEVVYNLGALAQGQGSGSSQLGVVNQSDHNLGAGIFHILTDSGEQQAVHCAYSPVAQSHSYIRCGDRHLEGAIVGSQIQQDALAVGNGDLRRGKLQPVGNHNLHGDGTHLLTVVEGSNGLQTGLRTGGVHAVGVGAGGGGVGQTLCRQLRGGAGGVNALDVDLHAAVGGDVAALGQHGYMVEHAGGSGLGGDDDTVDGGTGSTVGGDIPQRIVALALTLGQDLGGAAAVTVDSPLAAQCQHGLAQLIGAQAHSVGRIASFGLNDHQSAVLLDADHGTVGGIRAADSLVHQLAVLHHKAEVAGNSLPLITMEGFGGGAQLTADSAVLVLGNCQIGLGVAVELGSCQHLAVVNQEAAGSLAVVGQSGVHTGHNIVAQLIPVVVHLDLHGLGGPVGGIRQILVDAVVCRENLNIGIVGIYLDHMQHLAAAAAFIVDDDVLFNSAVTQNVLFFRQDGVVIVGDTHIEAGSQGGYGNHAQKQQDAQRKGKHSHQRCTLLHLVILLCMLSFYPSRFPGKIN